tara:strand:+ start:626 stop:793 length:168 start_codon:yes stop_codon:yes gene_type:complete
VGPVSDIKLAKNRPKQHSRRITHSQSQEFSGRFHPGGVFQIADIVYVTTTAEELE